MLKKSKILIVDDEPGMCRSLAALLSARNHEVQVCNSGNEALNHLAKDEFDLILMDVFMEGMNGFQVIENLMNQKIDIPVIIMTGNASTESAVKALRMGAVDYLKKPFGPEELSLSIKNALDQKILKEENEAITKKLIESEKRFCQIYDNILDVYYEASLDGIILEISPSIERYSLYNREELIGKSLYDIYTNPADRDKLIEVLLIKESVRDYEINLSDRDGTQHTCSMCIELIKDTEDNPAKIVGIFRDITERKSSEEELRQSEEKYRTMVEHSNDMIWTLDKTGSFTFFNKQAERVTGFKLNDWIGKSFLPLIIEEDLPMIMDVFQKGLQGESLQYELRFKKQDNNILTISVNTAPIWKDGEVNGIVSFGRDITDKKMLETQLQHAQKMEAIGTLAGGIAHDFNNILSGIFGYSQLAEMQIETPEEAKKNIGLIVKGAQRAAALVQQILTFSRQSEYKRQPLSVFLLVKEALRLLRSTIPSTIKIKENIFSKATVLADPTQIHQVIMNLCTNAYHAMSDTGGVLTVGLNEVQISEQDSLPDLKVLPGKYLKLEVSDTGHGIHEENLGRIFDPYFTTKGIGKGTGLGLAMVDGIVKNHNGFIRTRSEINHGTTFQIFWPMVKEQESSRIPPEKKKTDVLKGTEHIMFVDDETNILDTSQEILEGQGYQVTTFKDGLSALQAFTKNPDLFDLIITDMAMPRMAGDELSVKALKTRKDIPIILCTGFSETMSEQKASDLGIKDFLLKPYEMAVLSKKIRKVLGENIN